MDEPNPNSPANSLAAQLYVENRREYIKRVGAIVEESWISEDLGTSEPASSGKTPSSSTAAGAEAATATATAAGATPGNGATNDNQEAALHMTEASGTTNPAPGSE